jgi:orotidine-5'-phosphate decarboxylase
LTDLGPYIAVLKTHVDVVQDFSIETVHSLRDLAKKHNFLIFEDRKFIDIGNTVQKQYHGGALHISEFAHIVNLSILGGEGIIEALSHVVSASDFPYHNQRAFILLADMTSKGSLATGTYTSKCVELARVHNKDVIGFIAMRTLAKIPVDSPPLNSEDFLIFTTGVNQKTKGDKLGQQYQTPTDAVRGGADFIITGRGIYTANNPVQAAQSYQKEGWEAYIERIGKA